MIRQKRHHLVRLEDGKSDANRLDSWISISKEKQPPPSAERLKEPNHMADLPSPPAMRKHMTTLSDVSVYSFCDAQTTPLSRVTW